MTAADTDVLKFQNERRPKFFDLHQLSPRAIAAAAAGAAPPPAAAAAAAAPALLSISPLSKTPKQKLLARVGSTKR